jgi:hypothetical protein
MNSIDKSWRELEILPRDRRIWNVIVTGLCPHGAKGKRKRKYLSISP